MQRIDGELVLSPTDLTKHLACRHVTTLDLAVLDGALPKPELTGDELELIFRLGLEHERRYLDVLKAERNRVVEIPTMFDGAGRREAERLTVEAMRDGADVIYQATFFDGAWGGQADFLLKVGLLPSALGPWSYEVADTKLARRLKVPALLQMAVYAERLEALQGVAPRTVSVVTGDGESRPWRLVDVAAFAARARRRLRAFVDGRPGTEPVKVQHCGQCRWSGRCTAQWRAADDLVLVAGLRVDQREVLRHSGITTLAGLADCLPDDLPRAIGRGSRERLVQQAAEQYRERVTGHPSYTLLPPEPGAGLLRLPAPDAGDRYLDFEGDPYADEGRGREYLAGLGTRDRAVTPLWAHSAEQERQLTIDLVDQLLAHWRSHPDMHVYHYAPYETTALKRLAARHGVREAELDQLLRGERFVDLYAVVRQGMRISKASYSIKKLEDFYWAGERSKNADVADALASVVQYEKWLVDPQPGALDAIEAYNRDDVLSTLDLHDWLEGRRAEVEAVHGSQPRPHEDVAELDRPVSDDELAELDLAERLRAGGEPLMADLVQWHRREDRPGWWEFFRVRDLHVEDLEEDPAALGPLSSPVEVGRVKRSRLFAYTFAPQETRLGVGDTAYAVGTAESIGTVAELDPAGGRLVVRRAKDAVACSGVGPPGPIASDALRAAIAATGEDLLRGVTGLGFALLRRVVPEQTEPLPRESAQDAVVRVGRALKGEVLAVQGPPGSGKSTVAARLIRALLDEGKTVGVTATSHAVIGNLLRKVDRPAVQRCNSEDQFCGADGVTQASDTASVLSALHSGVGLVGGTAWLWAADDMRDAVDVLVVDEAGQFSLANAVAVARGARSMVLLGDPQQLAQPSQGLHPEGAAASALEHLLDGHETVPPERGVFLDRSFRMHPAITAFVSELSYEGRLRSAQGREVQAVDRSGSGLRMVFVEHRGNAARCPQEAAEVGRLWESLVGRTVVTVEDGVAVEGVLTSEKILVVTPFNRQVAEIRSVLPDGARVGTVDKFQGQEAPVVIYSMTSSSAEDAPRGVDFLYDLHRLNVAVSRAQALSVVVASPALLDAAVHSPEQLRQVNALCRYAAAAQPLT